MANLASHLLELFLTPDRKRAVRLRQWLASVLVYSISAILTGLGVLVGVVDLWAFLAWAVVVWLGVVLFYVLLRSGWSERLEDKALTQAQILFASFAVLWGYFMCGPVRSAALFYLLFVFMFGAFSLDWRRIIALAVTALGGLAVTVFLLHHWHPGQHDLRLDVANFLAMAILLPSTSWLTAQLSELRENLQRKRSSLAHALTEVERLATRDELTGLLNRRAMQDAMNRELSRSQRTSLPFCIAMVDLDHFKRVNDVHGHAAGDLVLKGFAEEASKVIRGLDTLSRWGGEEFLLIMAETTAPVAFSVLERMRERLEAHIFELGAVELIMTMSAGIAESRPGERLADTIARADEEVYRAKSQGRNRVSAGTPQSASDLAP